MLKVKLLVPTAKAPSVAHAGEDLGYDVYSAVEITIAGRNHGVVSTGIAIEVADDQGRAMGALLRDKSSMAAKRIMITGGVIDAGYRGEVRVLMENLGDWPATIHVGDKIANLIPYPVLTGEVRVVEELADSKRKAGGFGSTGKR